MGQGLALSSGPEVCLLCWYLYEFLCIFVWYSCVYVLEEGKGNLNCHSLIAIHLVFLRQGLIALERPSLGRKAGQHALMASLCLPRPQHWELSMKHATWLSVCVLNFLHSSFCRLSCLWAK